MHVVLFCLSEPQNLTIDNVTTASFRVSFQAPPGNEEIDRFEVLAVVAIEGACIEKRCTLAKSATPLECEFSGLLPATMYTVGARSCLPYSIGCGRNATDSVVTTPAGKHNIFSMYLMVTSFGSPLPVLAPKNFTFVNITGSSVGVKIEEPKENNFIKRYEAYVKGGPPEQSCVIKASEDSLMCTISGLSSSHEYTVGVKACVHGSSGCGPALEKSFSTV